MPVAAPGQRRPLIARFVGPSRCGVQALADTRNHGQKLAPPRVKKVLAALGAVLVRAPGQPAHEKSPTLVVRQTGAVEDASGERDGSRVLAMGMP